MSLRKPPRWPSRPRRERDLDIKKASYLETSKKAQAQADKAYEIETNRQQQTVVTELVRVQQVEREAQVKVQEAEIERVQRELVATVLKQAEVERQRIETLASAERQRMMTEAEGRAAATRAQGEAEAEIIFKKGDAEARAMNVKAEAFQEYNQAAVVDKLITGLAGSCPRSQRTAQQSGQDHGSLHRQRRCCRSLQDHW